MRVIWCGPTKVEGHDFGRSPGPYVAVEALPAQHASLMGMETGPCASCNARLARGSLFLSLIVPGHSRVVPTVYGDAT